MPVPVPSLPDGSLNVDLSDHFSWEVWLVVGTLSEGQGGVILVHDLSGGLVALTADID